ncbi:MAG: SRPBCC domain-containing protein [Burkholderiaceae bacterium]|jgi:hypothetical protein|nr:SRPBCC domain-containing protein [Burkholderiaceae bacterium]
MTAEQIHWPMQFSPANSAIHVVNSAVVNGSPEVIWEKLIDAHAWPQWYANAHDVRIDGASRLGPGVPFRWRSFGVSLVSRIEEWVPQQRLAWTAFGSGISCYHAWLIEPLEHGCRVRTEETQNGLVARLGRIIFPGRMERWHQRWLEAF